MGKILVSDIGGTNSRFASFFLGDNEKITFINDISIQTSNTKSIYDLFKKLENTNPEMSIRHFEIITMIYPINYSTRSVRRSAWNTPSPLK